MPFMAALRRATKRGRSFIKHEAPKSTFDVQHFCYLYLPQKRKKKKKIVWERTYFNLTT